MQKFRDVLSRWERKDLSGLEAGELLGMSERQFRRYRVRYEDEGLAGLADKRLGKMSERRVPVDEVAWMLAEYRTQHMGWNVKHFHEHLQKLVVLQAELQEFQSHRRNRLLQSEPFAGIEQPRIVRRLPFSQG